MAHIVTRKVWNSSRKPHKTYLAKYLAECVRKGKRKVLQQYVVYLGMANPKPVEGNIFDYLGTDDLGGYFEPLPQKERIRKVLEFWLVFNSIKDPERRSHVLIEKPPFKALIIDKPIRAIDLSLDLKKCGWDEQAFYQNLQYAINVLWKRPTFKGKKIVSLKEFRESVGL